MQWCVCPAVTCISQGTVPRFLNPSPSPTSPPHLKMGGGGLRGHQVEGPAPLDERWVFSLPPSPFK